MNAVDKAACAIRKIHEEQYTKEYGRDPVQDDLKRIAIKGVVQAAIDAETAALDLPFAAKEEE